MKKTKKPGQYWTKITDDIRNITWYVCDECMGAGINDTKSIHHHVHCSRHRNPVQQPVATT